MLKREIYGLTTLKQIVCALAESTLRIVTGTTLVGFGAGVIMVAYPGISELLPNKYRYATY